MIWNEKSMQDFDMSGVPGEELSSLPGEERLGNLMQLIEAQRGEGWQSRLSDILDSFEDFLTMRPEPPQAWLDTYAASGKQFDYYQIVLPKDFEDPYEDDLGNIRRLRSEFERVPSTMALEHELISRNYFVYENGHAESIPAPRPMLMLESQDRGSYVAYNLENDDEEVLGEDFKAVFQKYIKILAKMQLVIPVEGRDYGILRSDA